MENETKMGLNRTPMGMAPRQGPRMLENSKIPMPSGGIIDVKQLRQSYLAESDSLGSVPLPATFKGLATSIMQKLVGKRPEVLIDKLGERLAFERTGTRLYELALTKAQLAGDEIADASLSDLVVICEEERGHFLLLTQTIEKIGGDPTAVTPCADAAGVMSSGLVKLAADPRASFAQTVQALLVAELTDRDGWELLVDLVDELGMEQEAQLFRRSLESEARHLAFVRELAAKLMHREAGVGSKTTAAA